MQFILLIIQWYNNNEQNLFRILDTLAFNNFTNFLKNIYKKLLYIYSVSDMCWVLKVFKKLYELKIVSNKIAYSTIEWMQNIGYSIKIIADKLSTIVNKHDFKFVNWISKILKLYIKVGECWSSLKTLLLTIENVELNIVETILQECIITHTHIEDININIVLKLCNQTYSKINHKLMSSFKNLMKFDETKKKQEKNILLEYDTSINSSQLYSTIESEITSDECLKIVNKKNMAWETNKQNSTNDIKNKNYFTLYSIGK